MQLFSHILSIFLLGAVLLLAPNIVLAIDPPSVDILSIDPPNVGSFSPVCPATNVNFVGLELDWDDVVGVGVVVEVGADDEGEIVEVAADHYELYYRLAGADSWEDRYPRSSQFSMSGLTPNRNYNWYVVSCGTGDCSVSADSTVCSFQTEEAGAAPPPGGGGGDDDDDGGGGGGGGDGGDDSPQPSTGGIFQFRNPISSNTLPELINNLLNLIFGLSIVITPLVILYAGFLMLTAAGDASKLQKARTILIWTIIAFAIILVAKGAPNVIRAIL